jgi:drug/metabolite transporter (DMT)-like permease
VTDAGVVPRAAGRRFPDAGTHAKLVLTALFWGGTFVVGRLSAQDIEPYAGAFLRFAMASSLLLVVLWKTERRALRVRRRDMTKLALLGVSGAVLYNAFFFKGLQTVTAGRAAVIVALNPSLIALLSARLYHDRLSGTRVVGLLLSLLGALVVISSGKPLDLLREGIGQGDGYILGCVGSWVAYTLLGKAVMARLSPLASVTWSSVIGTAGLAGLALHEGIIGHITAYPPRVWLSSVYLAVFGTVFGFVWFYQGIRVLGATRAGVYINFVPASSVLMGCMLLHEPLSSSLITGLLLVTVGVTFTNATRNTPSPPARHHPQAWPSPP